MAIDFSRYQVGSQATSTKKPQGTGTIDFSKYSVKDYTPSSKVSSSLIDSSLVDEKKGFISKAQDFFQGVGFRQQQGTDLISKAEDKFNIKLRKEKPKQIKLPSGFNLTFTEPKTDFDLEPARESGSAQINQKTKSQLSDFYAPEAIAERRKKIKDEIASVSRDISPEYKEPGIFGSVVESIKESAFNLASSLGATSEMIGNMTNSILLTKAGQKIQLESQKVLASNPEWREAEDAKWNAVKVSRLVAGAVPSILGAIGATFVAGVPGGVAVSFSLEAGSPYAEAIDAGLSEEKARQAGVLVGSINAILEMIFPTKLLDGKKVGKETIEELSESLGKQILKKAEKFGVKFAKDGSLEGGTELIQELWGNVIAKSYYDEDRPLWQGLLEAFIGGFGSGGIAGTLEGNHTPQEVIDQVIGSEIEGTTEGNILIKSAIEAQQNNQNIVIAPQENQQSIEEKKPTREVPTEVLREKAVNNLKSVGVETSSKNVDVETIRAYMNQPPTKTSKFITTEITNALGQIGVDELSFNNDKITLWRAGEVVVGEPNAFSLKKVGDDQTAFIVNKDEVAINTMSQEMKDLYEQTYGANQEVLESNLRALKEWNAREAEVIVVPKSDLNQVKEPKIKEAVETNLTKEAQKYKSADYLYHGTNDDVLENIVKEGLKPGKRGQLSLSKTEEYARSFAKDGMTPKGKTSGIVLRVNADALEGKTTLKRVDGKPRPMSDQLNEILTNENIPPEALEIYTNGKWQKLTDIWNKANKETKAPEKKPSKKPKTVSKKESVKTETQILPENESIYEESKKVGAKRLSPDRILHHQMTAQESITKLKNSIEKDIDLLEKNRPVRASQKVIREFNEIELKIKNNQATEAEQKWFNRVKDQINVAKAYLELKDFVGADKNIFKAELLQKAREKLASENGVKNYYIRLVKKDISKGYKFSQEVLGFDRSFTVAVNNRARYEKGLRTSFSADDERIVFDDKNRIIGGLKRQDGNQITQSQIEEIVNGVLQTQEALGIDINKIARDERWIYAHLNGKNPFLTANAGGMYRKTEDGNISISVGGTEGFWTNIDGKRVRKKVNTTVAHELGHALDHHTGQKIFSGEDIFELRKTYKPIEYSPRSSKYWSSSSEIKARAIEQYVAIENGHEGYFEREAYWNEDVYNKTIKPMVEDAMDKHFSEYQGKPISPESIKQEIQEVKKVEQKEEKPLKAQEKEIKPKTQEQSQTKASKVAVSIEQNLNERFDNLAGFETRNVKSQAKLVSKLIAKDINKARDIVTGKAPLPAGMSGSMFIAGVEQYATENNDIDLLRSLAVSPLVSETSVHAQELRFLAERDKTSVLSKIQEIANERAKIFKRRHSEKLEKVVKKETAKIKESVKVSKWDWNSFIKSIEC